MSERQTLITITDPSWDEEDQEWLVHRINTYLRDILPADLFTIQEFEK